MKKLIIVSVLAAIFISANSQIVRKPLKGQYFEIVSDTSLHIYTEEGILSLKTYPTNFYWGEVDSLISINTSQLMSQGPCDITLHFKLFWDYFSYWNWYNPYRLKLQPNSKQNIVGTILLKQVDLSNSFALTDSMDFWIKRGIADYFHINQSKILNYDY